MTGYERFRVTAPTSQPKNEMNAWIKTRLRSSSTVFRRPSISPPIHLEKSPSFSNAHRRIFSSFPAHNSSPTGFSANFRANMTAYFRAARFGTSSKSRSLIAFSSIFLCFSVFVASSASASLPSLLTFNAPTSELYIGEGGKVTLSCHYEGEVAPRMSGSLVWYYFPTDGDSHAGDILTVFHPDIRADPEVSEFQGSIELAPSPEYGSGALAIKDYKDAMEGRFICRLWVKGSGFVDKAVHDVKTAFLESPQLQDGSTPIKVTEGVKTSLICSAIASPRPDFTWLIDGNRVDPKPEDDDASVADGKRKHESVFELDPSRDQQNVPITCIVNGPGVWTVPSRKAQWPNGVVVTAELKVLYPPYEPYIALEDSQWFYQDTVLAIGCTVADRGYPEASLSMVFPDDSRVATATSSIVHKSFRLKSYYDKGAIICEADNGIASMKKKTEKILKVASGPERVEIDGELNVEAGQATVLTCKGVNANPEADIRWFGAPQGSSVINVTRLRIMPSWKDNGANITCRGRNPYYGGNDDDKVQSVTLNVRHKPVWHPMDSPQMVLKPMGEEALLTCSVVANPADDLVFQWRFQGQIIPGMTTREIKVRANDSTFGSYSCSVINSMGNSTFVLRLVDSAAAADATAFRLIIIVAAVSAVVALTFLLIVVLVRVYRRNSWRRTEAAFCKRPMNPATAIPAAPGRSSPRNEAATKLFADARYLNDSDDVDSISTPIAPVNNNNVDVDNTTKKSIDDEEWNATGSAEKQNLTTEKDGSNEGAACVRAFHRSRDDEMTVLSSWQREKDAKTAYLF